ncbi:MAG: AMP-binding protein [Lachnospiraceae bacterium]|nr:AMP-binding protein [Lachnospiraceae bacterium]
MKRSRIDSFILNQENERLCAITGSSCPSLSRQLLDTLQLNKLNDLLAREKERGGFYRNLPDHLNSLADLSSLPFTTEADLAAHAPGLLLTSQSQIRRVISDVSPGPASSSSTSSAAARSLISGATSGTRPLFSDATSGTTSAPKRVFYTEGDLENTIRLYEAGLGELIFPGSVTLIGFPSSHAFGLGELICEAIRRLGGVPLPAGPALTYGEYQELLETRHPDTFVGMPTQLLSILRACKPSSLKRALVSGDACPASVISVCEALLGTRLFPHYGSREMGMAGAITCPAHEGMHLRENDIIAEIVGPDGTVLPDGQEGELVITTIGMEALPLIRYKTGDITRLLPGRCPCGSVVRRLGAVHRRADMQQLDEILFAFPELVDYRAALPAPGVLHLEILHLENLAQESLDEGAIRAALQALPARPASRLPAFEQVVVSLRPCTLADRALYASKRVILNEIPAQKA